MSFAKSFYADQKPATEKPQEHVPEAIPASTPIAEDPLTPAQIQEAIRLYRSVLSASAPSSPVRHVAPVKQAVHSNYYGGGPTDIPLSYLNNNYSTKNAAPQLDQQQLVESLQNLKVQEVAAPVQVVAPQVAPQMVQQVAPQAQNYYDPSEYIGMANDNKFIYDAQKAVPKSYSLPAAPVVRHEEKEQEEHGTTTTEDVTQVPASPAVTSRFRAVVQNVRTPIVVERVEEPVYHAPPPVNNYAYNNNYGTFNQMESEYQLPVLNDLASCIEHY